jgi:hypothetical protein
MIRGPDRSRLARRFATRAGARLPRFASGVWEQVIDPGIGESA